MSICLNNYIRVRFEDNTRIKIGELELIRPEIWDERGENGELKYDDNGVVKSAYNTNGLETKPQICEVLIANPNYPFAVGDRLFVHYMAWETAMDGEIATNEGYILSDYVFFVIGSGVSDWKLVPNMYIGEPVIIGEEISQSGIVYGLGRKDTLRVKITHVPHQQPKWGSHPVQIGDTVLSIDTYNYEFEFEGKKYIKLTGDEIACIVED
jgi:co-chaperonin GroES (HSP10)